ncbi:MAG: hypothetical protein ABI878_07275 [Acidobacteriota bacterium]
MGTLDGAIVPAYTKYVLDEGEGSVTRRNVLKNYAISLSKLVKQSKMTDLEAFADIALFASLPFMNPASNIRDILCEVYLEDLRRVLIGDGFTTNERNNGKYALGFNAFHDSGFKKEYQDGGNQVQHAMAGIYISFRYGFFGRRFVYHQEDEDPDLALYRVTFDIGADLDGDNFRSLPSMIKTKIGG